MKKVRGDESGIIEDTNNKSLMFDDALAGYMSDGSADSYSENMTASFADNDMENGGADVVVDDDDDDDDDDDIEHRQKSIRTREQQEKDAAKNDVEMLSSRENRWVAYARTLIVLSLIGSAITASCLTYFFMNNNDTNEFLKQYTSTSIQLINELVYKTQNVIYTTSLLANILSSTSSSTSSTSSTSLNLDQNQDNTNTNTFPFFTMDDFETFGHQTIELSGAKMVGYAPIITDSNRRTWESYSYVQQGWINNSYNLCYNCIPTNNDNNVDTINHNNFTTPTIYPFIYHRNESSNDLVEFETTMNEYSPLWQTSPPPNNPIPINLNLLRNEEYVRVTNEATTSQCGILSKVIDVQQFFNIDESNNSTTTDDTYLLADGTLSTSVPHSIVVVPIYKENNNAIILQDNNNTNEQQKAVAHVIALVSWIDFLKFIYTKEHPAVIAVLTQCDGISYSFQIKDTTTIQYLGPTDVHDSKFDPYVTTQQIKTFDTYTQKKNNLGTNLSNTDDDNTTCTYEIKIYPTDDFIDAYDTRRPLYFTIAVLVVFCFTSLMFLLYDALVQYRQSKLIAIATKTTTILSGLFPAQVRDQLFGFGRNSTTTKHSNSSKQTDLTQQQNTKKSSKRAGTRRRRRLSLNDKTRRNKNNTPALASTITDVGNRGVSGGHHGTVVGRRNSNNTSYMRESLAGNNHNNDFDFDSKPIADLFPNATVLFADIAGFTAWSSVREPCQVFILLETIYRAFDNIAKKRRVFKVETIGDCYVAVVGLPDPEQEHAIVMARFARDILEKMNHLTHRLESTLGPDTGDLKMRIGCHSGPVTAGVLRGDRARFQLFGDTVNTAARMESTGVRNKIQISQDTADLIVAAGKPSWIDIREDVVHAKGKGELQTYWLKQKVDKNGLGTLRNSNHGDGTNSVSHSNETSKSDSEHNHPGENSWETLEKREKLQRMIDWNADILIKLLRNIVSTRRTSAGNSANEQEQIVLEKKLCNLEDETKIVGQCMNDVVEVIELAAFDEIAQCGNTDKNSAIGALDELAAKQMHDYVSAVASMYQSNPFHNFEHAGHVSMSTVKLLSRIVAVDDADDNNDDDSRAVLKDMHDCTYGITSDPLTQFAVVFSALIHDVDHQGVPNFVLCKENVRLATVYKNQSVAEQNSIDIAWTLLMDPSYINLRRAIYTTEQEMKRFRLLVVNSVMATDIFDKELSTLRKTRWEKAFNGFNDSFSNTSQSRKATIVIEHLIQASDVSHTMQHWHVYQKWNERLYLEMYVSYTNGRTSNDPTDNWYEGELKFFDGYIIPLARKLKECGVFGVSSDEYLNYAEKNRSEWERKGKGIVTMMRQKYGTIAIQQQQQQQQHASPTKATINKTYMKSGTESTLSSINNDAMELANLDNALRFVSSTTD